MNGSNKIQETHRQRQAVVYLRQSSPKQVLENRESALNQRALCDRLAELGWKKSQIVVIDEDQGKSAKQAVRALPLPWFVLHSANRAENAMPPSYLLRARTCSAWQPGRTLYDA